MNGELAEQVVTLAEQAGRAILEVYHRSDRLEVVAKSDQSPLTEADISAHHIIVTGLKKLLPEVPVLSEEGEIPDFEVRDRWPCYWLVDPLDGTREFIRRNGEFTVNIALIDNHMPVLGVVHVPVKQTTYTGLPGFGAFKHRKNARQKLAVRRMDERVSKKLPVIAVASRRQGVAEVEQLLQKMAGTLGDLETRNIGSSLKLCLVAEGSADIYPRLSPTCEWDTAAAQAVVEAAGGVVLDRQLQPMRYNTKDSLLNPCFFVIGDPHFDWTPYLKYPG